MMNLSLAQVKKFGSEIQALKTRHQKAIEKANDVVEQGIDATLVSATAFGLGVWQTRSDTQKLLGVPIDLAVGLAAHAAGFMGVGGKAASYMHCVGNGALGWPDEAPFERILVAAGGPAVPPPLVEQLAEGGRMVLPVGSAEDQVLTLVERVGGEIRSRQLGECKFVKLVGKYAWES